MTSIHKTENEVPKVAEWFAQFCILNQANMSEHNPMQDALYRQLAKLSNEDVHARSGEIKRLMRSNGFIDGSYSGQWNLDPIPHLINPQLWMQITQGITQRVELLNQVLADLVGNKNLLLNSQIDGQQLFTHPFYLGESDYRQFPASLFMVAFDIGITDDDQLYALQDHCQFPRGLGLLLENRIISRRVMSEEFYQCDVEKVAGFFQDVNNAISEQTSNSDARVVILTQGPNDSYYSEQVYLATYLGYTLVRSADLTVRKGTLWLKALNGLKKVDVVLRWIEDRSLDSLEQSNYSDYGVPGLLHAVRSNNVKLLNNYGCGLLQIPAIQNKLSMLSHNLNNQQLIIKQPLTFAVSDVDLENISLLELRSYSDPNLKLDGATESTEIKQKIAEGNLQHLFFREKLALKQVPFWHQDRLKQTPVIFRCFALHHQGHTSILPSALCITLADKKKAGKSIQIKDAWVARSQLDEVDLQKKLVLPKVTEKSGDMALLEGYIPSRTAENLYSLGSVVERTENLCRLLRVYLERFSEWLMYPEHLSTSALELLVKGIQQNRLLSPFDLDYEEEAEDKDKPLELSKALSFQTMTSKSSAGSLENTLASVCNTARNVRELLSYDSQRILESLETEWTRLGKMHETSSVHILQSAIDRIISLVMAFRGSLADSLSNATGDFMFDIGIRSERLHNLFGAISTMMVPNLPGAEQRFALEILLTSQVSSVTHRRRYRMHQSVTTGLELLILAHEYPRSIAYQVEQLIELSKFLPDAPSIGSLASLDRLLLKFKADCHLSDAKILAQVDADERKQLHSLMRLLKTDLKHYLDLLNTQYFTHTKVANKRAWSVVNNNGGTQ